MVATATECEPAHTYCLYDFMNRFVEHIGLTLFPEQFDREVTPIQEGSRPPFRRQRGLDVSTIAALLLVGLGPRAVAQARPPGVPALSVGGLTLARAVRTRGQPRDRV